MKKDKITAVIVFLTVIFIVFVFGLYIGKKFSSNKSPKEGIIKESALKKGNGSFFQGNGKTQNGGGVAAGSAEKIKFAPISKLSALKKGKAGKKLKKPAEKNKAEKPAPVKTVVKTKIVYVKKPVYIYKYKYIKKSRPNPFNSKVYYTIQVAALSKYSQAKAMADKLNSMGFFCLYNSYFRQRKIRKSRLPTGQGRKVRYRKRSKVGRRRNCPKI